MKTIKITQSKHSLFLQQRWIKVLLLSGIFLFNSSNKSSAQSITYYPFNSVLGVSSNPNNFFWADLRLFTNSFFSSMTTDVAFDFNIAETKKAYYYLGGGAKLNMYNLFSGYKPVEGYFINSGVRVRPFDNAKRVQFIFEISPYVVKEGDMGLFRTMLGIGYNFNQRQ